MPKKVKTSEIPGGLGSPQARYPWHEWVAQVRVGQALDITDDLRGQTTQNKISAASYATLSHPEWGVRSVLRQGRIYLVKREAQS